MATRCGESRARDLPSTWRSVTLRMVMDPRPGVSRLGDLDPRPLPSASRTVGDAARVVPRAWGTGDPAVTRISGMAADRSGARSGPRVLGRSPAPPAPCPGSVAWLPHRRRPQRTAPLTPQLSSGSHAANSASRSRN